MKILKSTTLILIIIMLIIIIHGVSVGLPLLLFCFGLKVFVSAKELYDEKKNKFAIVSVIVGVFVCICAVFSITNVI